MNELNTAGIRDAEEELNCAEAILDSIAAQLPEEPFLNGFSCIGDYIEAVVSKVRKAEQEAARKPLIAAGQTDQALHLAAELDEVNEVNLEPHAKEMRRMREVIISQVKELGRAAAAQMQLEKIVAKGIRLATKRKDEEIAQLKARLQAFVQALDKEMVTSHIGVFNENDDPAKAINDLMLWSQGVGEYFAAEKLAKSNQVTGRLR